MTLTDTEVGSETAEQELFLLCGRSRLNGEAANRLRSLLDRALDWDTIMSLVDRHHIHTLLYRNLSETAPEKVPADLLSNLRSRYFLIAAQNLARVSELTSLFQALEAAGAPAVAWKGPVLAYTVYPNPELRIFSDLDIMLRRKDTHAARAVLHGRGYRTLHNPDTTEDELFDGSGHDVTMWNPEVQVRLDVHWGTIGRYRSSAMDCERLWPQNEELHMEGSMIRALEPDTQILALSLHAAKHRPFPWPALKWVTDMEAFLHVHPSERWEPLLRRARDLGCQRRFLLGLRLAQHLLDAPLPPVVDSAIRQDPVVDSLIPEIRDRMVAPGSAVFTFAQRLRFDLAVRERMRDRFSYRATRLLTPGRNDVRDPPLSWEFLRVPLRLLRLGRKYLLNPSRGKKFLVDGKQSDDHLTTPDEGR